LTGVHPDCQIISEWYSERFYKLFANELETIQSARIRKMDVLRMDELKEPKLNINSTDPIVPFQMVQFISWDSTPFGRKEMQTSFPIMLTISESQSLFDLRKAVAEKVNLPYRNINVAFTSSFPILEGRINPIREICKQNAPPELMIEPANSTTEGSSTTTTTTTTSPTATPSTTTTTAPMDQDEDEDSRENKLAEQENRDKRTFNFKAEKATAIKKAKFNPLDIICWEDLRIKVDKADPHANPATRNKKTGGRDTEVLKIKN